MKKIIMKMDKVFPPGCHAPTSIGLVDEGPESRIPVSLALTERQLRLHDMDHPEIRSDEV